MAKIKKLYMLKCGNLVTPDHFPSAPNTTKEYKKLINVSVYILEHPEQGLIMVDTGVSYASAKEHTFAIMACLQPGLDVQLAKIGKTVEDVKHVLISHYHDDHCEQNYLFPHATFHIREKEWEGVHDLSLKGGYSPGDREACKAFEATNPKLNLIPDVEEYDIFGDGSVISWDTKGHTPGHQSFLVHLESGKEMFLAMDATHSEDELYDSRHFINAWDLGISIQQTEKMKAYRERTGNTIWICHDAAQWYDAKKFPEYYE